MRTHAQQMGWGWSHRGQDHSYKIRNILYIYPSEVGENNHLRAHKSMPESIDFEK